MAGRNHKTEASGSLVAIDAGDFSIWLGDTETSLRSGKGRADVPCGACRGCCRSSMFIHIKPEETRTLHRIPRALLFPAPGLPRGHMLMGYGDKGNCPMLVGGACSIYEDRPQTCRDYDCRVFAATGVQVDEQTQREIAERVKAWTFRYESEESREQHRRVKQAAAFLQKNRGLFPAGSIPRYPVQVAALAVRVYKFFSGLTATQQNDASPMPEAAIAQAILIELREKEAASMLTGLTEQLRSKRQRGTARVPEQIEGQKE